MREEQAQESQDRDGEDLILLVLDALNSLLTHLSRDVIDHLYKQGIDCMPALMRISDKLHYRLDFPRGQDHEEKIDLLRAGRPGETRILVVESFSKQQIIRRDNWRCQGCRRLVKPTSKPSSALHPNVDHIVPLSRGGNHTKANCQLLCHQCNMIKGAREWSDLLQKELRARHATTAGGSRTAPTDC